MQEGEERGQTGGNMGRSVCAPPAACPQGLRNTHQTSPGRQPQSTLGTSQAGDSGIHPPHIGQQCPLSRGIPLPRPGMGCYPWRVVPGPMAANPEPRGPSGRPRRHKVTGGPPLGHLSPQEAAWLPSSPVHKVPSPQGRRQGPAASPPHGVFPENTPPPRGGHCQPGGGDPVPLGLLARLPKNQAPGPPPSAGVPHLHPGQLVPPPGGVSTHRPHSTPRSGLVPAGQHPSSWAWGRRDPVLGPQGSRDDSRVCPPAGPQLSLRVLCVGDQVAARPQEELRVGGSSRKALARPCGSRPRSRGAGRAGATECGGTERARAPPPERGLAPRTPGPGPWSWGCRGAAAACLHFCFRSGVKGESRPAGWAAPTAPRRPHPGWGRSLPPAVTGSGSGGRGARGAHLAGCAAASARGGPRLEVRGRCRGSGTRVPARGSGFGPGVPG